MRKWLEKNVPDPASRDRSFRSGAVAARQGLFETSSSPAGKSTGTALAEPERAGKTLQSDEISFLWHELLSPLNLIKGYTTTLQQFFNELSPEEQQQYISGIDSACNRMVRLLENLRDISRLENTSIMADQSVSMLDLLRKTAFEMQNQTSKHTIRLRPRAPLPHVKVDPERIEQVVTNLLANAIKYSPDGGDIEIEIRTIRSDAEINDVPENISLPTPPLMVISVADRGIGIPPEDLEKIFEKFYRSSNRKVRSSPGAGLGLYICKIIVEAHGGCIWAANRPEGGSIFTFTLPLNIQGAIRPAERTPADILARWYRF